MHSFKVALIMLALFHSASAHAYLDPGSGSAIISVIAATVGSLWHSLKSVFYRLIGKKSSNQSLVSKQDSLVIFNEGKAYWGTFRPLIEELIKEKIPFRYFTLDLHDPALKIESQYMESKRLSLNSFSLALINNLKAPVMVSTTPNIGTPGYPITKPSGVKDLVHLFHHVGDISIYKRYSLDHYDSVILIGDFQQKSIRKLEHLRKLKAKKLVSLGLLYLDDLLQNLPSSECEPKGRPTILIGSSWGNKGCLQTYGTEFITTLVNAGFTIIIRPHPQSAVSEPTFIERCKRETSSPHIKWDEKISPSEAMHKSQILISDTSSLRFDYAFLYGKPIITLAIPRGNLTEFEAVDLEEHWHESAAYKIGTIVNSNNIVNIVDIVKEEMNNFSASDLEKFKAQTVLNFGKCAPKVVSFLNQLTVSQGS
jgi:hypothetical protein